MSFSLRRIRSIKTKCEKWKQIIHSFLSYSNLLIGSPTDARLRCPIILVATIIALDVSQRLSNGACQIIAVANPSCFRDQTTWKMKYGDVQCCIAHAVNGYIAMISIRYVQTSERSLRLPSASQCFHKIWTSHVTFFKKRTILTCYIVGRELRLYILRDSLGVRQRPGIRVKGEEFYEATVQE